LRNPRIARGAEKRGHRGIGRQAPDERVLARTAANDQNPHYSKGLQGSVVLYTESVTKKKTGVFR
jgi:hypothetical protein